MHWDYVLILLILGVIVPWRGHARVTALLQTQSLRSRERAFLYISTIAFQWAISLFIVWRCSEHGLSFADLGLVLPRPVRAVATTAIISAVLAVNQILGVIRLARVPLEKRGIIGQLAERLLPRGSAEKWIAFGLVLTVAVCEELIYRGFMQYLFQKSLSMPAAGLLISAAFFALAHAYQGKRGIFTTFAIGVLFSGIRIWTGSLLPTMIIHFAVDFSVGVAFCRLLPEAHA